MIPIKYIRGDATRPAGDDPRLIVHICNDIGGWGKGFVGALSRRWREPEVRYRAWARGQDTQPFGLGEVQFVEVEPRLWVANLIGQHNIRRRQGDQPIRYEAVREGLSRIADFALEHSASVHMPRIGAGLAGGDWTTIAAIIEEELCAQQITVTVYDLPTNSAGT
jgi:O-acetyl-ADP-ribose deacetylase (regulator of RNase III)